MNVSYCFAKVLWWLRFILKGRKCVRKRSCGFLVFSPTTSHNARIDIFNFCRCAGVVQNTLKGDFKILLALFEVGG